MKSSNEQMKPRDAAWFVREVRKQLKKNPTRPVRFDITKEEWQAWDNVFKHPSFVKDGEIPMVSGSISEHADPILRSRGFWRAAFFAEDFQRRSPIERVNLRLRGKDRRARRVEAHKKAEALQAKWGPEYHVALLFLPLRDAPHGRCIVWRGEDWLANAHEAFYPAEVAKFLAANIGQTRLLEFRMRELEPDARRGRKVRGGASDGGNARSKNFAEKRAECRDALKSYRLKNPNVSLTAARRRVASMHAISYRSVLSYTTDQT